MGKALSEALQLDEVEVTQAKWMPIAQLAPLVAQLKDDDTSFMQKLDDTTYSTALLFALRRYLGGQAMPAQVHLVKVSETQSRKMVFIR